MARRPVNAPYTITTEFGVPDSNALFGYHSGIDYAGFSAGRPIYAPANGTLTNVVSPTGGNMVVIFDGKYYHRLMHNSSFSRTNGAVTEGQEVAKAGTTGLSTGVHCHWDINNQGTYPKSFSAFINPNQWVKEGGAMPIAEGQINDNDDIAELWRFGFFREPTPQEIQDYQSLIGKYWSDAIKYLRQSDAGKQVKAQYEAGAGIEPVTEQLFRKKG